MTPRAFLFFATLATAFAASQPQVEAWKKLYPAVNAAKSPQLRELASGYLWLVQQATPANISRTTQLLREKSDRDLATLGEKVRSIKKSRSTSAESNEAHEKMSWLEQKLLPFLGKAPN